MRVACAECGCIVDAGVRIAPCDDPRCCCRELPIRERTPPSPSGVEPPPTEPEAAGGQSDT